MGGICKYILLNFKMQNLFFHFSSGKLTRIANQHPPRSLAIGAFFRILLIKYVMPSGLATQLLLQGTYTL